MHQKLPYKTYAELLTERFPCKMQKISIDAGFSCPNRDGSIGTGGCIYCNNKSFVPQYCTEAIDVRSQLEEGIRFFGKKYSEMRYMAYFQAYTSTYDTDSEKILRLYKSALDNDKVLGLIISTRPDCIGPDFLKKIKSLGSLDKRIMFEIGVETVHDKTLKRINRGHFWHDSLQAIEMIGNEGLDICAHLIMGLPGETIDEMLDSVEKICRLPVTSIKLHQLQVLKGTALEKQWEEGCHECKLFTLEEYIDFCCDAVRIIPAWIAIERFTSSSPAELLLAPKWGIKNYQFINLLNNKLLDSKLF